MPPNPAQAQALLVLPLIAGFLFLELCHLSRFRFRTQRGYRVFLWAAATGVFLLTLSRILVVELPKLLIATPLAPAIDFLRASLTGYADFSHSGSAIGSIFLAIGLAWVCNLSYRRDKALRRAARRSDSFLYLLLTAYDLRSPVAVMLDNRKSYVGYIISLSQLEPDMTYCKLVPTLSGYRTEDELHLELPLVYEKTDILVSKFKTGDATKDDLEALRGLQVVLQRERIVVASFFDEELYEKLQELRSGGETVDAIAAVAAPTVTQLDQSENLRGSTFAGRAIDGIALVSALLGMAVNRLKALIRPRSQAK